MKLNALLRNIPHRYICGDGEADITGISWHCDQAKCGDAFLCIVGHKYDGHIFINKALARGAQALILTDEDALPDGFSKAAVLVENVEEALGQMSINFFGEPCKKLSMIGITGTKGKTTTCYMIHKILNQAGIKTGMISTVAIDDGIFLSDAEMTTPVAFQIHEYLYTMVQNGCKACVMEVSSQGVMRKRIYGVDFDIGVFTNISNDHIGDGEHENFHEYFNWKKEFFKCCKVGIVNSEDPHAKELIDTKFCTFKTYGDGEDSLIRAEDILPNITKNSLSMEFDAKGVYNIKLSVSIAGSFNVSNALAACMVSKEFDISTSVLKQAFRELNVPGRMSVLRSANGGYIIIDYAHNGVALESLLVALKEYEPVHINCLFGCGGNRAKARRYEMGMISGKYADLSIITSDNPRFEPQMAIINDIIEGINKTTGRYIVIPDRAEAIYRAVELTEKDDFLVIAGKGHEKYQIIGDKKLHFDDMEIAKSSIERRSYEQNYSRGNS